MSGSGARGCSSVVFAMPVLGAGSAGPSVDAGSAAAGVAVSGEDSTPASPVLALPNAGAGAEALASMPCKRP
eukprot:1451371-Rhodomonas_salina.1